MIRNIIATRTALRQNLDERSDHDIILECKIQSLQSLGGFMTVAKNHPTPQQLLIDVRNTDIHLSPTQFERLQSDNPGLRLELTEDGKLLAMSLEVDGNRQAVTREQESSSDNSPAANSTHTGTYNLVEMTPEETARRVAAFDRFIEYKRQLWESLTPEEQLESDQQFENLAKLLEESRS